MNKWFMSGLIALACVFGVYLLATALPEKEPAADKEPAFAVPDRAVDAEASEQIYRALCISCHGDQLQGGVGPALAQVGSSMTKEQLYETIKKGKRGMPAFENRLTEDEIITIATWLASHE
ncbi:c-type cytochrome [Cohnella hongkongensis]|uniref:C-type cytochrome n=1 Tax=Cohnella hongkongensis TaxID=178337 RepID=A0ABV9FA93_9BACL